MTFAVGAAGLCAVLSAAGLLALNTGWGFGAPPAGFGFSQGFDDAAFDRTSSARPTAADLSTAEALSTHSVRLSPYATAARLRLAYIDTLRHGHLTVAGASAFARSYDLVPIDPDVGAWRIRFGLEHWEAISPEARTAVWNEAKLLRQVNEPSLDVNGALNSVQNSSGRLAAALWQRTWDAEQAPAPKNAAPR